MMRFALVVLFVSLSQFTIAYQLFRPKSLDDSILYKVQWTSKDKIPLLGENDAFEKVEFITNNNEKYGCFIPVYDSSLKIAEAEYEGPSAFDLLLPLFKMKICTIRIESFWTYELCHGQSIKQFHKEYDGISKNDQEYVLGVTSLDEINKIGVRESAGHDSEKPIGSVPIEGVSLPYFEVVYSGGTPCDLTGKLRTTRVLYVCLNDGKHSVYSVKEIFTCEYEMVVLSSYLCKHPDYRPKSAPQMDLSCVAMDEEVSNLRPKDLRDIEMDSLMMRTYGKTLKGDTSNGRLVETSDTSRLDSILDILGSKVVETIETPTGGFDKKASVDTSLFNDFLTGRHCLHGGSGWWRYEVCLGRYVQQYRQDGLESSKYTILLGSFDFGAHEEWLKQNPKKKYRAGRQEVSQMYSGGAYCHDIADKRQVEVKLKCKEAASSISLYLLEPSTCRYVLGVESSAFCSMLSDVDESNLLPLQRLPQDDTLSTDGEEDEVSAYQKPQLKIKRDQSRRSGLKGEWQNAKQEAWPNRDSSDDDWSNEKFSKDEMDDTLFEMADGADDGESSTKNKDTNNIKKFVIKLDNLEDIEKTVKEMLQSFDFMDAKKSEMSGAESGHQTSVDEIDQGSEKDRESSEWSKKLADSGDFGHGLKDFVDVESPENERDHSSSSPQDTQTDQPSSLEREEDQRKEMPYDENNNKLEDASPKYDL